MTKVLLGLLLCSFTLHAADNLTFSGTLVDPSCEVNGGETIEIDFGDVSIDRIDGNNYKHLLGLNITCEGTRWDQSVSLTYTFSGTPTDFNPAAVATDVDGLGVEIRQNDIAFNLGSVLDVNELSPPTLEVVPVKRKGVNLSERAFEAWVGITVEYL